MPLILHCSCGMKMKIPPAAEGKRVRCPQCQQVSTAPTAAPQAIQAEPIKPILVPQPMPAPLVDVLEEEPIHRPKARRRDYDDRSVRGRGEEGGSGLGIASMVCGIVALPALLCWPLSIVLALVGIVLGACSLKSPGKGMGIAGLACGIVALCVVAVALIFWGAMFTTAMNRDMRFR